MSVHAVFVACVGLPHAAPPVYLQTLGGFRCPTRRAFVSAVGLVVRGPVQHAAADVRGDVNDVANLLRLKLAVEIEAELVASGRAPQPSRVDIRKALAMAIRNFELYDSLVGSLRFVRDDQLLEGQRFGEQAVAALEDLADASQPLLVGDETRAAAILAQLRVATSNIEDLLALVPRDVVRVAKISAG